MRYLKVIVLDRNENGRADTVKLCFSEKDPGLPDELVHTAVAFDTTADGAVDVQSTGDIDFDGASTLKDRRLLKAFANQALKLSWFNKGRAAGRSVNLYVGRYDEFGVALEVKADFYQRNNATGAVKLAYSTTGYDRNASCIPPQDDQLELFDPVDTQTIHALSTLFIKFGWF